MFCKKSGYFVACVANVSVRFRSKERRTRLKDRAKNGASKRAVLARPKPRIPFLGLSLLRNQTETLATQARYFVERLRCRVLLNRAVLISIWRLLYTFLGALVSTPLTLDLSLKTLSYLVEWSFIFITLPRWSAIEWYKGFLQDPIRCSATRSGLSP